MNIRNTLRAAGVTVVTLPLIALTAAAAHAGDSIDDFVPEGPDYSGVSFLSGPTKEFIGVALAVAAILAVIVIAVNLVIWISGKDEKAAKAATMMKRAGIGLAFVILFNLVLTGGLGFISDIASS